MLVKGDLVHCPKLGEVVVLRNHLLRVDSRGYIDHLAHAAHPESLSILMHEDPTIIPLGSFLMPTFCDLHLHAPQFMYQGTGLHLPLMEWLNEYAFKAEESLDADPQLAESVYKRLAARLIEHGTGAVLLFGTIKTETNLILARVMQQAGIRAFVGKLSTDISSRPTYVESSADASLEAARLFCDRCIDVSSSLSTHERLVEPVITPRFVPTCSNELLAGLGTLSAEKNIRIQSHMAESHDQVHHVLSERGSDDMDVFAQCNLLTSRTVQAHCTFLTPPSLMRLAKTGTAVAHCPLSNAYFSAEPFRLREAIDTGVRVGLGTDIAGGYSVDIMNAMRQAVAVSRMREGARISGHYRADSGQENRVLSVDWKEAFYLATKGGAEALNLAKGSGSFVVGAPFDAQHIQVFDAASGEGTGGIDFFRDPRPGGLTLEILEKWWCVGDLRNRKGTWVQGKSVGSSSFH
ncbi:Metallo-dependent hydrolase [Lentinus brumalis]|uniref:Metallo-dependent hydrolase n=1 Tax=Lentinus brumalis TaxID=2498619 RepID=A0A371CQQ9_9APHY|nr:Metallo-dependent hydrolase [Polyporus brumalis]